MSSPSIQSERERPSWLYRLLGRIVAPWLSIRREPAVAGSELIKPNIPVCYAIERYGLSNVLILEQACAEAGLPSPLVAMKDDLAGQGRSVVALSRRTGFWFRRPRSKTHSEGLANLIAALHDNPELDVQIVPVSIFVGRAPDRQSGWFRVLFAENWAMVGRFRRFLAVVLNGRNTIVRFSDPVSLREVLEAPKKKEITVRKISRVLRTHFRRIRTAVIGPDLSHRRTLVDGLLASEPVRQAIQDHARKENVAYSVARGRAHAYAMEIAADYSHTVIRSMSFALTPLWNKMYRGVSMHHFEAVHQNALGREVIYVPCHRSHIDYLLLSYLLYTNGLLPPHIAAGVNLNLPIVGPILRRGGAFFLRRSFKSNALYSAVFSEYVATLVGRGDSIEYFIEGGRSRTGRLLAPKAGMLVMTLRAFLRQPSHPVMFQPVYIGYEQVIEGKSYLDELSGRPKQKETIWVLLRASFDVLRRNYGRVAVSYAEPVMLDDLLETHAPQWREERLAGVKPTWINAVVDDVAQRIQVNVNRAAVVNPINLLAVALLSTPKFAMSESDLLAQLGVLKALLIAVPYSDRVIVTPMSPEDIIAYGEEMKILTRTRHPLGDVLSYEGEQGVLQTYFRNNVLHLFVCSSWVASCFQNSRRIARSAVSRIGREVYPFLRRELFLPWDELGFENQLEDTIDAMVGLGLLSFDPDTGYLQRSPGQTDEVFRLRVIANSMMQAFERYYISISVLVKNGSGTITASELENLCHLSAQRLSLLYAPSAPEFFDRSLFRGVIATLRELGLVRSDAAGKLIFDHELAAWANDSKLILSRELRHSILKVTPEIARETLEPSESEASV